MKQLKINTFIYMNNMERELLGIKNEERKYYEKHQDNINGDCHDAHDDTFRERRQVFHQSQ